MKIDKVFQEQITLQSRGGHNYYQYRGEFLCREDRRKGDEWPEYTMESIGRINRRVDSYEADKASRPV